MAAPPPKRTVSQWADEFRRLSSEASAEPGAWMTTRAEYQRGIMDAVSDPAVHTVVVMKSAQVGWTEIINNTVGYHIHQDPAPIMVVQPTIEMGEAWSKDRLAPMLRDSPALRGRVADARTRDSGNTLRHKTFAGGHITIAGANSPASLASRPIRVILFDECDRYPPSAGAEGDPITLGRKRTATFWNRKTLLGSSPTIAGVSRIEAAFNASDQRRYFVPCWHCGEKQTLRWQQVRWTEGDPTTALYHCEACGAEWTDVQRWSAVRRGEWRASQPFAGVAGFHISELYSPWRRLAETAADFLEHKDRPEQLKAWINTALGETWQEKGEAPDWARLYERREPLPRGVVPAGALVLTAGADNQVDRVEASVWAWGPGLESWLVDTAVFDGSPSEAAPWDGFAALMARHWPVEGGGTMQISRAGVDTGGSATAAVYGHLRRLRDPRILPLKGTETFGKSAPVTGPTPVDVTEGGRKLKRGLKLWIVAVSTFKSDLYKRLWLTRGDDGAIPKGWVHLPEWLEPEQVKQLVAEQLVTVKDKRGFHRMEWRKLRDRNEQLDMAVYARAALAVMGADRAGDGFWRALERERSRIEIAAAEAPRFTPAAAPAVHQPAPLPPPPAPQMRPRRSLTRSSYMT